MKYYQLGEAPLRLFGLPEFEKTGKLWRLPEDIMAQIPTLARLGRRSVGARIRFRTDSAQVCVKMKLLTLSVDKCISITGSAGANVYIGTGKDAQYVGFVSPLSYDEFEVEKTFAKPPVMQEVTVYLPRNEQIDFIQIGVEDGAAVEAPTPYAIPSPVVYYGSSITEGGCASRVGNAYWAILTRWLDADAVNLGFSGNAKGEQAMAEYIAALDMRALVIDYDHNAQSVSQLEETHLPFFETIRKARPDLPIVLISRPDFDSNVENSTDRRRVILETYSKALACGDRNVFFIDGRTLFGTNDRYACTVDTCHPNDLGFMRMAEAIYPVLKDILYPA